MLKLLLALIQISLLLILPFFSLIRGAVYFHEAYQFSPWLSLLGGVGITVVLLFVYFVFIYGWITGGLGSWGSLKRRFTIVLIMVIGYSAYSVASLSDKNAKTTKVKSTFTSLHPILRLSISTIIFLDETLVVTDGKRLPEDYRKMGLPSKKQSLHYVQNNGYVHAVDIRTNGRGELRNTLVEWYAKIMGFNTLRHTGTGDHLHISLTNNDLPHAI